MTRGTLRAPLVLLLAFTLLTGVAYPLLVTAIAQFLLADRADGSLVVGPDGTVLGSRLVGQAFDGPQWFHGRPSATARVPYDASASAGSNLGPGNPALHAAVAARIAALRAEDPGNTAPIPVDLVTASASGLDPHISPAAAAWQAERVARVRGLPAETVRALIAAHTAERTFGVLGEPRVHVLPLNLALADLAPAAPAPALPALSAPALPAGTEPAPAPPVPTRLAPAGVQR